MGIGSAFSRAGACGSREQRGSRGSRVVPPVALAPRHARNTRFDPRRHRNLLARIDVKARLHVASTGRRSTHHHEKPREALNIVVHLRSSYDASRWIPRSIDSRMRAPGAVVRAENDGLIISTPSRVPTDCPTMHFKTPMMFPIVRPRQLPTGVRICDVADACRAGAIAFLNGVSASWGKRELAAWLAGPYRKVTRYAREGLDLAAARTAERRRKISPQALERVMREAQAEVLGTLRDLAEPDGEMKFAFAALGGALVTRAIDGHGDIGWVPVSPMRMRLPERILSLIAVDFLVRPSAYEEELAICSRCSAVMFHRASRARGLCRVHSASGVHARDPVDSRGRPPRPTMATHPEDNEITRTGHG